MIGNARLSMRPIPHHSLTQDHSHTPVKEYQTPINSTPTNEPKCDSEAVHVWEVLIRPSQDDERT